MFWEGPTGAQVVDQFGAYALGVLSFIVMVCIGAVVRHFVRRWLRGRS